MELVLDVVLVFELVRQVRVIAEITEDTVPVELIESTLFLAAKGLCQVSGTNLVACGGVPLSPNELATDRDH